MRKRNSKFKPKIGEIFHYLKIIKEGYINEKSQFMVPCECKCGKLKDVRYSDMLSGFIKSCGCYQKEIASKVSTTHGLTSHPTHILWSGVHQRCTNPKHKQYNDYGGRGIIMCEEWLKSYFSFYTWCINNGWEKGLQLDRIDNDGNYEPNNCRFVTPYENLVIGRKRMNKRNSTGFVGVTINSHNGKYKAQIYHDGVSYNLGSYEKIEDAVEARIQKEVELFGEQRTNFHYKRQ